MDVREIQPGEYEVVGGSERYRVVVPAGVGLPGVADEDLAGALVAELADRGRIGGDPIDVSAVLRDDPGLLFAVERRVGSDEA